MKFAAASVLAVAIAGCGGGSTGPAGAKGDTGLTGLKGDTGLIGPQGLPGVDKTTGTVDALQLTFDDLKNKALSGKVLSVDTSANQPVVNFQVTMKDTGEGVRGLRSFSLHIAKLVPAADGSASYWLNYLSKGLPLSADPVATSAKTNPSSDGVSTFNADGTLKAQGYAVTDNADGTYSVKFGANIKANTLVAWDAAAVHRVVVGVRSVVVPGVVGKTTGAYAGPLNPITGAAFGSFTNTNGVNFAYDFTPAASGPGATLVDGAGKQTYARDNVTVAACNQCHYRIEYGSPARGNNTSGHFGSRTDTKTCVMCHTPQNTLTGDISANNYGQGDFTNFVHKIHMGEELGKVESVVGVAVNEIKYPQDQRNCTQCHKGTVADSYKLPTIKACGACHNAVDFTKNYNDVTAPLGHKGGIKTDDKTCALCHDAADIGVNHIAVIPPDQNNIFTNTSIISGTATNAAGNNNTNASYLAAAGVVPPGAAKITYVVSSVKRDTVTGNPSIVFKLQKDGADVVFNTYNAVTAPEMMTGFVGSPSIYFAYGTPQDGIASPADFNTTVSTYLKNIWRGDNKDALGVAFSGTSTAKGTLTGPVSGYYTLTLTQVNIPASATMLTGGVGYTYGLLTTMPLTQTNVPAYPYTANAVTVNSGVGGVGGISVPAPNVWKVASAGCTGALVATGGNCTGTVAGTVTNGYTGRRLIVDTAKCNACHTQLGVKPTFHAGQRNDAQTCTFCHNVNRTNSGWPVNIGYDVHALHNGGSGQRTNKFTWEATSGAKFWEVGYPGQLKNCEGCHIAGMYDFSNSAYTSATASVLPKLLMTTAANGTMKAVGDIVSSTAGDTRTITTIKGGTGPGSSVVVGTETFDAQNLAISPFVSLGGAYGATYAWNSNTGALTNEGADANLVLSPISGACSGCHDSTIARAHMQSNGGTVFGTRAAAKASTEQCLVCHGPANNASFNDVVPAIKTVHRWW